MEYVLALLESMKDIESQKPLELLVESFHVPRDGEIISITRGAESIDHLKDGSARSAYQSDQFTK